MGKGKSWGHQVRPMSQDEMERRAYCSCGGRQGACPNKPAYVLRYWYVTGRAGRTTDRINWACEEHARRFAERHGLPWPPAEVTRSW